MHLRNYIRVTSNNLTYVVSRLRARLTFMAVCGCVVHVCGHNKLYIITTTIICIIVGQC